MIEAIVLFNSVEIRSSVCGKPREIIAREDEFNFQSQEQPENFFKLSVLID